MFSNRASSPPKGSVPIRAFSVIRFFMLFMSKVLWAVMRISTHLPSRLGCQQRGLNGNTPFILDNLIGYHRPAGILTKVLGWFCLERYRGRPSTRVTEIREWSNVASIRKTEIIFKVGPGAAFRNPWSPDLSCLSGLLLMTLSWVGSHVLASSKQRCGLVVPVEGVGALMTTVHA